MRRVASLTRMTLLALSFIGTIVMFVVVFPRFDAIWAVGDFHLNRISAGASYDWSEVPDGAGLYIVGHVVADLVFMVIYGTFLLVASSLVLPRFPRLAWVVRLLLMATLALDLAEDVGFLVHAGHPALSVAKLVVFAATALLAVSGLIAAVVRRRR